MNRDLDEARQRAENIRAHLPSSISIAALGVRSKTPYHLLAAREALIWRTEELARCACDMLERDDLAAGSLLARAVTESAAFVWRLKELLETRDQYTPEELHDKFQRMFLGWKAKGDPDYPESFNIVTLIDHMDRKFPDVRDGYDHLSEFAHPNWSGVSGLFSSTDYDNYVSNFGRGLRQTEFPRTIACNLLVAALAVFQQAYNSISDNLPGYLEELEPL